MDKLRMCIVCREMQDKRDLIRIVKNKDNEIFVDLTGKKNGRGAYVCKKSECLNKIIKQKTLNKTFKMNIPDEIYEKLREEIVGYQQN